MASGGSRARSGPTKDASSRTSERAGYTPTALPNEGYRGRIPGLTPYIPKPTARHKRAWQEFWRTPQACMWSQSKWEWPQVAVMVRLTVAIEDPDCPAAKFSELAKLQTRLGLTEEGLRYRGWAVAKDELAAKAAERQQQAQGSTPPQKRERRLAPPS